jgi:hypothetical protein
VYTCDATCYVFSNKQLISNFHLCCLDIALDLPRGVFLLCTTYTTALGIRIHNIKYGCCHLKSHVIEWYVIRSFPFIYSFHRQQFKTMLPQQQPRKKLQHTVLEKNTK